MNLEKIYKKQSEISAKFIDLVIDKRLTATETNFDSVRDIFLSVVDDFHELQKKALETKQEINKVCDDYKP